MNANSHGKKHFLLFLFQFVFLLLPGFFCTFMIEVILAKMIRKMNKYVTLDMLLFNVLSWVIEKCLKFGSMEINIKHSTNFFRKVAAPTGQDNFKKIIIFKLRFLPNQLYILILMKNIIFTMLWPE